MFNSKLVNRNAIYWLEQEGYERNDIADSFRARVTHEASYGLVSSESLLFTGKGKEFLALGSIPYKDSEFFFVPRLRLEEN